MAECGLNSRGRDRKQRRALEVLSLDFGSARAEWSPTEL
jgi:hypothetical protein